MSRVWPLLTLIVSIVVSVSARGQDPYYTNINKSNGLPSNAVYDIFQDKKGFIWIGNNEGLTRYDGFEFKTYLNNKQTSRAGDDIKEDKYGRIWYKNFDGYLYYVENDTLKSLTQNLTVGNTGYALIDNRILVLQKTGIDIFDLASLKIVKTIPFDCSELVSQLQFNGYYYVASGTYLYKISGDGTMEKQTLTIAGGIIGSKNGLLLIQKENPDKYCYELSGTRIKKKISIPDVKFIQGSDYCNDLYWFFTTSGAWAYDENGNNINGGTAFFATKNTSCVLHDRDGNYWMGTLNEGILFIPDIKTKLISRPGVIPNTLFADRQVIYIGTKDNEIYSYNILTGILEQKYRGDVRHEVTCLLGDTANHMFFISSDGLSITDQNFHIRRHNKYAVKDMCPVDRKYCAYTATGLSGLIKQRTDITSPWDTLFNATAVASISDICNILRAGRGKTIAYNPGVKIIYVGSNNGLYSIGTNHTEELKFNGETVYIRKLVNYGNKTYALSAQNFMYVINSTNAIQKITLPEGNEQPINLKKTGGNLYLLTNKGLKILDTATGAFTYISFQSGNTSDINDLEIIDDKAIIASDRGLVVMDKRHQTDDSVAPGFTINSILVNGIKKSGETGTLHYTENDIEINYSILTFNTSRRYELLYKINDGIWQHATSSSRMLKLASLAPGAYNISFRLSEDNGRTFPQNDISFTIKKAFWAEWWFLAGCFILLTAGIYSYYKWQTRLLKKKNALVLEKVELEKNLRNSMLTSIRAQMNPHFFYNALNSIQSFIFFDDKRNASTYLVKLSRLTRMILEMSEKETISLDEETDALKLYLELEKMRFSNNFNYEIRTGQSVESELVKIPSMIVQPYVENAIKHGLLHKKGEKYLSIEFLKDKGNLCITIEDNGIGREKAGELNNIKKDRHHSFSTNANSKRIELLNKERSKNIGVVYIDKKDEDEMAAGTTVIISIPLI